jgi:hypothetical protein
MLSVSKGGSPVNAIDRVGNGPWYDRLGRIVAMTKADLQQTRPRGADPAIVNDLPNEDGVPNEAPDGVTKLNNHHMMTGSDAMGMLRTGSTDTCTDWTSVAVGFGIFGGPACGLAFPRRLGPAGEGWLFNLNEGGCAPGSTPGGAQTGPAGTVGATGGYGGFYCLALTP